MPSPDLTPLPPPLDGLFESRDFHRDAGAGMVEDPTGARVVLAPHNFIRGLHDLLRAEKNSVWQTTFLQSGIATGKGVAVGLDAELARFNQPALAALPLETCLIFIERYFASHGWGRLKLDLTDAPEHGLVSARLQGSYFVEVLGGGDEFADPLLAGILQGFFEYVSGQELGCLEIACMRRGAAHCTFVITAPDRLAAVTPLLGSASADAIIARLKA
jgi:hypothetical protein